MSNNAPTSQRSFAHRARKMVGREEARQRLAATMTPGGPLRVVLVRGRGGLGKTRLLEEVLLAVGREPTSDDDEGLEPAEPFPVADTVIGDLIDVVDTHLHDRFQFIVALRRSLQPYRGGLQFDKFDAQLGEVENLQANGVLYDRLIEAQEKLVDAFVKDLRAISQERRVVLLVDTVERLSYVGPRWLFEERDEEGQPLLGMTDLEIRTHHWLLAFIERYELDNVTLVLSGRDQTDEAHPEGHDFFQRVHEAVAKARQEGRARELEDIDLQPLGVEETRLFFEQYAADFVKGDHSAMARSYQMAADPQSDRYKVIRLYTEGVPVRLALYAQIIAEGKTIPQSFDATIDEARAIAKLTPDENIDGVLPPPTKELQALRWEIEEQFIELLFRNPDDSRQKAILALLRAPRGLTAEQLHFVLDTNDDEATWVEHVARPAQQRQTELRAYLRSLDQIARDYWGKRRAPYEDLTTELVDEPRVLKFRIGLQDELYRIYAEHMGLFAEPLSPETQVIRDMPNIDKAHYEANRAWEARERQVLYRKLAFFADYHYQISLAHKRAYLHDDEVGLEEHFVLERPNTYVFPTLSRTQQLERLSLHKALTFFEIERMIYRLLLNPEENLNSEYITLEDDNDKAARHEEDFWAQAEMWRVVSDDWLIKFVDLHPRPLATERSETSVTILRRVAEQESVARWIKRFVLRGRAARAIKFSGDVEKVIGCLPDGEEGTPEHNTWYSWNHSLAREERAIWTQVAHIRQGQDVAAAIRTVEASIAQLLTLYLTPSAAPDGKRRPVPRLAEVPPPAALDDVPQPTPQLADNSPFPLPRIEWIIQPAPVASQYDEYGFAPGPKGQPAAHPAYVRIQRLLSHAHNYLGFSYRTQGQMTKAVQHYTAALEVIRSDHLETVVHRTKVLRNISRALWEMDLRNLGGDERDLRRDMAEEAPLAEFDHTMVAHRGTVLNNLSRPLSELGWNSLAVALDGRRLRWHMAEEVPLAASYNTLALIYDDMGRYEDAPLLSAKAIAYCRRATEKRQLGLSLRQMAESLRHISERLRTRQRASGSPNSLLNAAEELLNEARVIFADLGEIERQIEVNVELGSLFRDRLQIEFEEAPDGRPGRAWRTYYQDALGRLDVAERHAKKAKLWQHVLDAQVNQARVHRYAGHVDAAEKILDAIDQTDYYQSHLIGQGPEGWPSDPELRNTNWVFRQMSTAQRIRGQIAFGWFDQRVKELRDQYPEDDTSHKRAQRVRDDKSSGGKYDQPKGYAQDALHAAATAYVLAYAYAGLYSSRSRTIGSLESDLYYRIRKFNRYELDALHGFLREAARNYSPPATHQLPALNQLIDEFFGPGLVVSSD